jgi:UDP-N-acetylglucosamine 2-epimerase (non-hydrolysing)
VESTSRGWRRADMGNSVSNMTLHVVGARPNFMKAAPVVRALLDLGERVTLVHTGQHYDAQMSDVFFRELQMPEPDVYLGVGSGSHGRQTAKLLTSLEDCFLEQKPDRIVVYGDVNSTMAATLTAAKLHIPVAHVEAGLRSFDRTMPEEVNRVITDSLADLHFVTSPEAIANLAHEGIDADTIAFVGNSMIDTLDRVTALLSEGNENQTIVDAPYGVVTLHRPSNVDDFDQIQELVQGLSYVSELIPLVFPVHPRGQQHLDEAGLADLPNVDTRAPMGFIDFVRLMAGASLVFTDSGGIQEETTVLGVPCLTLRTTTERPITVTWGTNRLVPLNAEAMLAAAREALGEDRSPTRPPLWDGKAGTRIAKILAEENG